MTEFAFMLICYCPVYLFSLTYYGSDFIYLYKLFFNLFSRLYTTAMYYFFFLILGFMEYFK